MISEHVPVVTSIATGRPEALQTGFGAFGYRHIRKPFFAGFRSVNVAPGQSAFLATPEKALLDLIFLSPRGDDAAFIEELRLQGTAALSSTALKAAARPFDSPSMERAVAEICARRADEKETGG